MDRIQAYDGALVADAAAMGLHWMYDQSKIAELALTEDVLFREPDPAFYAGQKAYFAHGASHAGDLSHYGVSARLVGKLALDKEYSPSAHRKLFFETFGPCGSYTGYADRPTKALIAKMIIESENLKDPSGSDDDQMPTLCVVPGLFAAQSSRESVMEASQVISTHPDGLQGVALLFDCLELLVQGASVDESLLETASMTDGALGELMIEALNTSDYQPLKMAEHFGMPCHVSQGIPIVWHLMKHAPDYSSAVRDNILCGGDTCGRAMALGAIAGLHFSVPQDMKSRLSNTSLQPAD